MICLLSIVTSIIFTWHRVVRVLFYFLLSHKFISIIWLDLFFKSRKNKNVLNLRFIIKRVKSDNGL